MAGVQLRNVSKVYADGTKAVDGVDLDVEDGEFVVLVGPSGCGKTTVLRMIAGLEDISAGAVRIGDTVVNDLPARDRDVAMVFQNYALYPHLSVAENIGFGLKLRGVGKADRRRRVEEVADVLGLTELLDRKPRALSGGQRQRVAMGRAIVRQPAVFLMDEPLSNLDAKLRVQMRAEIMRLQSELGVTTVYVTHDQTEAMTMGDRVAVMRKGLLQQVAPPQLLYDRPVNLFVGGFIGSPAMNLAEGELAERDGGLTVRLGSATLSVDGGAPGDGALDRYVGGRVVVGIRPEELSDAALAGGAGAERRLTGRAEPVERLGREILVHLAVDAPPVLTEDTLELAADVGVDDVRSLRRQAKRGRPCSWPSSAHTAPWTKATRWRWPSTPADCTSSTPRRSGDRRSGVAGGPNAHG
ncbi:MAG: sn-glycerol-3-phosphate ABC transporter ATP-binding protein UgpC [Acidimicrobiales bacterium]